MSKKRKESVEQRLVRSMEEAVDIARGKRTASRAYELPLTARSVNVIPTPKFTKAEIADIRRQLNLSQQVFADALNVSIGTVRSWEQGARVPEGPSVRLLELAQKHPAAVLSAVLVRPTGRSTTSDLAPPDYLEYRKSHQMTRRAIRASLDRRSRKK